MIRDRINSWIYSALKCLLRLFDRHFSDIMKKKSYNLAALKKKVSKTW